jgi:hypothetical protein
MKVGEKKEVGFAPEDLADGRKPGEWQTRYGDPIARRAIKCEALYVSWWLIFCLIALILVALGMPQQWLELSGQTLKYFNLSIGAWLSGTLGGTLFSIKWLYHTVAHNYWNIDRRIWRFFTPHISGVFGFIVIFVIASGLFGFFDSSALDNFAFIIGVGFLTGYFSDAAAAKLADIATIILGKTNQHTKEE